MTEDKKELIDETINYINYLLKQGLEQYPDCDRCLELRDCEKCKENYKILQSHWEEQMEDALGRLRECQMN